MAYTPKRMIGDSRGRPPTMQDKVRMAVYLDREEYEALSEYVRTTGAPSMSAVVRELILDLLKKS